MYLVTVYDVSGYSVGSCTVLIWIVYRPNFDTILPPYFCSCNVHIYTYSSPFTLV